MRQYLARRKPVVPKPQVWWEVQRKVGRQWESTRTRCITKMEAHEHAMMVLEMGFRTRLAKFTVETMEVSGTH